MYMFHHQSRKYCAHNSKFKPVLRKSITKLFSSRLHHHPQFLRPKSLWPNRVKRKRLFTCSLKNQTKLAISTFQLCHPLNPANQKYISSNIRHNRNKDNLEFPHRHWEVVQLSVLVVVDKLVAEVRRVQ